MILPQTYIVCLLVLLSGVILSGTWFVTYKLAGKWRYELYYVDFAVGAGLAAILFCATWGNLGYDGFTITDDLLNSSKHNWLLAFGAGVAFNLGNMLTMGAASVGGVGTAYAIALGISLLFGSVISQARTGGHRGVLLAAAFLMVLAIAALGTALVWNASRRRVEARAAGVKRSALPPGGVKPIVLAFAGGLLMALSVPLANKARGELGVGPYALAFFFCGGLFVSTLLFSVFFMNLPVHGNPVDVGAYFKGGGKRHLLGLGGGVLWCAGALALWVVPAAPPETHLSRNHYLGILLAAPLAAAIWGFLFREYAGAQGAAKVLLSSAFLLFAACIAVLGLA